MGPGGMDASADGGVASDAASAEAGDDGGIALGEGGDDGGAATGAPGDPTRVPLTSWTLQSSTTATDTGEVISSASYDASSWYRATVPATVLGALVADGVYPGDLSGMNLRNLPGTTYPVGTDYLQTPVATGSPFAVGWWFRTQFDDPAGQTVTLHFDGISYRANIFVNGQMIADSGQV